MLLESFALIRRLPVTMGSVVPSGSSAKNSGAKAQLTLSKQCSSTSNLKFYASGGRGPKVI